MPDRQRTLYPALCLGILTAAFIVAKTGRDALFFQGQGIFQLPVATMMITAASLPLAMLFVEAMKSFGARPARLGLMLFAATVLAGAAPFSSLAIRRCCSIYLFSFRAPSALCSRACGYWPPIFLKPSQRRNRRAPLA